MPKPIMINPEEVAHNPERAAIKWGNKKVVAKFYSISISTVTRWADGMRNDPNFADGVVNPTHKICLINLDRFEDYFKWLDENRYKRG